MRDEFRRLARACLGVLFVIASGASVGATSVDATGMPNALIPDLIADPSVIVIHGEFYCDGTTDGYAAGLEKSGPPIVWTSGDFQNWSFKGTLFDPNFSAKYWAPSTPVFHDGRYYLYPTLNGNSIGVVTSKSPTGPFRNLNGTPVTAKTPAIKMPITIGKPIDAQVFVDDDGRGYMVWAQRGIARLHSDLSSFAGPQALVTTKRQGYSEGPFLFKRAAIYYYLYTLGGHESYQYAYMMSRISPLGPWEAPEQDIISTSDPSQDIYGPGHGSVFRDPATGDWYFVYLEYGRGGSTRQVHAAPLTFNADGTISPVKLSRAGVGALRPVKTGVNLALNAQASASSSRPPYKVPDRTDPDLHRVETYTPANAVDGSNGTRWMAAEDDAEPWFEVDLGELRPIRRTAAYFVKPTTERSYRISYSRDRKHWEPYGGGAASETIRSPYIDTRSVEARYLRIRISAGEPGLWEFKVY